MTTPLPPGTAPGDREAFAQLYRRYAGQVFGVVLARVGDRELAEDLTADTFVRAWRASGPGSVPVRDPRAWLSTIALNLVRDHGRSRSRRPVAAGSDLDEAAAGDPGPEDVVLARETQGELRRAVEALPPAARECLRLRFWQDLPVAATAEVMGCAVGTIKARQHRAVRALRAALAGHGDPGASPAQAADPLAGARQAVAQVHQHLAAPGHQPADHQSPDHAGRWEASPAHAQDGRAMAAEGVAW
ncbi:MAG: RNA polymerase sigma factor [Gemmatimonadales bacterium]